MTKPLEKILVLFPNQYDYAFLNKERFPTYEFIFELGEGGDNCKQDPLPYIETLQERYKKSNISAVISTEDYPGISIAAALALRLGLPNQHLQASLLLQHKYYCRQLQKKISPEETPVFDYLTVDKTSCDIAFPFFIKPVKGVFSYLAKKIHNQSELQYFITNHAETVRLYAKPFNDFLTTYTDFKKNAAAFIAEEILSGVQVTLDGYCWKGEAYIFGIVDSVKYPERAAFQRFEYPSKLPESVQKKIVALAKKIMEASGFNSGMFNIEMFYDQEEDKIRILEINPRLFFAAAHYYESVDSFNSYQIYLDIARGVSPTWIKNKGAFAVAATFTPRIFENKTVKRVANKETILKIKKEFQDAIIQIEVTPGQNIIGENSQNQGYKYAVISLGGKDWPDLYKRYERLLSLLDFEFV